MQRSTARSFGPASPSARSSSSAKPRARGRGARVLTDRGREPRLLEQVRVQVGDRAAQLGDGRRDGRVRARLGALGRRPGGQVEVVARREQVLDRAVVEILRELPALALLGRQRLGHEPLTLRREQAHRGVAARQQQREQREREAEPGEVGGLHEHERERAAARAARMRRRLQHVDDGRRRAPPRPSRAGARGTRPRRPGTGTRSAAARSRRPSCTMSAPANAMSATRHPVRGRRALPGRASASVPSA